MTLRPRRNSRITEERDLEILKHVARYRITTPEVLQKLFFSDSERNAVTKVTSRLTEHRFLASHKLYDRNVYFTLGHAGAKAMGISPGKIRPLGVQSLFRELGILLFCCRAEQPRERMKFSEFVKEFPTLVVSKRDVYYLDREPHADKVIVRLAIIWVEGAGAVDHVRRHVVDEIIEPRLVMTDYQRLIGGKLFVVAVVTVSNEKQASLKQTFNAVPTQVIIRVEAVPELIHLTPE